METLAARPPSQDAQGDETPQRFWSIPRIGILGTCALGVLGMAAWYVSAPPKPKLALRQQQALALIEQDSPAHRRLARQIALDLQAAKYRDAEFPGAAEYVLGMAAFQEGQRLEESKREERFASAIPLLQEAERLTLNARYRPQWATALGSSLHALGAPARARPYLEEALEYQATDPNELTVKLIETYLELKTPSLLVKALDLANNRLETLEKKPGFSQVQNLLRLRKAQVLVALERTKEALAVLSEIPPREERRLGTRLVQAQTLMALRTADGYQLAQETLQSLIATAGLGQADARKTHYLLGLCEEALGDTDHAINQFEKTTTRYPNTQEGIAASLKRAELLRREGRNEQALAAYTLALRSMPDPATYHNRWIDVKEFRRLILLAWNGWIERKDYSNAIALAKLMPPLFTDIQSRELEARAYEKWADWSEREAAAATADPRTTRIHPVRERWDASGDAYAALAELLKTSPKYSDVLWISAEHYLRGNHFQSARGQLEKFIATEPKERLARAYVHLAYTWINHDRTESALTLLEQLIRNHPKDPASFQAAYLSGVAHLERNETRLARQTWRTLLESSGLTPEAKEWKDALFALGSTLYQATSEERAALRRRQIALDVSKDQVTNDRDGKTINPTSWEEPIHRLGEFVRRYPTHPNQLEAQYLLARSYQKSAEDYRTKLERAEVANERQQLAQERHQRLKTAAEILRALRSALMRIEEQSQLDSFQQRLLQNSFFDLGDVEIGLQNHNQAILAYNSAINRYPEHVRVLLAYVQMANCYEALNQPAKARSTLKQAQVLADRMDDATFASPSTNVKSRSGWREWFDWALQMAPLKTPTTTNAS